MHIYKRKPRRCPECSSDKIAYILYGLPIFSPELKKDLENKKLFLGGCEIYPDDPTWRCTDCRTPLYREVPTKRLPT